MKKVIVASFLAFALIFIAGQSNQAEAAHVVDIRTFLSLREEPNTYSRELARIPNGAYLFYLPGEDERGRLPFRNGFYYVRYNGIWGWAHGNYISLDD